MSDTVTQLGLLLNQADELEDLSERVFPSDTRNLDEEEIRDMLIAIARRHRAARRSGSEPEFARLNPLLTLNQALEDDPKFGGQATLSLHHICQLKLAEFIFSLTEQTQQLHATAYLALQIQQFGFARSLLRSPADLLAPNHPVRDFFEFSLRVAKGVDETSAPRAMDILEQMEDTTLRSVADPRPPQEAFAEARQGFEAYLKEHEERLGRMESAFIEQEQNKRASNDVRANVQQVISKAVSGKKVPAFVVDFLHQVWSKYLYVTFLRQGVDSDAWRLGIRDMYQLIWSVVTRDEAELKRRMRDQLSQSLKRLRQGSDSIFHDIPTEKFFNALGHIHIAVIRGKEPDPRLFKMVAFPRDGAESAKDFLIKPPPEILETEPGTWFRIKRQGFTTRAKLIEINTDHGYLLFSNYAGVLSTRYDFDTFADGIRKKTIRPIDMQPAFEALLSQALEMLGEYMKAIRAEVERKDKEMRRAKEENKRQKRAAEERKVAKEQELKQILEAETRRREEQARQVAEKKAEEERGARRAALDQALGEVNKLQPGGMLELMDEHSNTEVVSLGLKLKRTGKLVFTDRNGRKLAEHLPEQLAEKIVSGHATILDYGAAEDKRLDDLRWIRHTQPD